MLQTQDTNEDDVINEDDGDILTVSECVTYLLYPFVTCGSTAGWNTGISVANTTMDDDVFGEEKGAAPQGGSVTLYGYPKSTQRHRRQQRRDGGCRHGDAFSQPGSG